MVKQGHRTGVKQISMTPSGLPFLLILSFANRKIVFRCAGTNTTVADLVTAAIQHWLNSQPAAPAGFLVTSGQMESLEQLLPEEVKGRLRDAILEALTEAFSHPRKLTLFRDPTDFGIVRAHMRFLPLIEPAGLTSAVSPCDHPPMEKRTGPRSGSSPQKAIGAAKLDVETIFDATAQGALGELASLTAAASESGLSEGEFLAIEEMFFNRITTLADVLTGFQTAVALQHHLDSLVGRSFRDEVNEKWVDLLNDFLKRRGYRVGCVGEQCENTPSFLRYTTGGRGGRLVFRTEHYNGKQIKHGGGSTVPSLLVVRA